MPNQNKKKYLIVGGITLLLAVIGGVWIYFFTSNHSAYNNSNNLIRMTGNYFSPNKEYLLKIEQKPKNLVIYEIKNNRTGAVYKPKYNFSDTMRWFFYWENNSTLWVYSGDIGLSYWTKDKEGRLIQRWATEKDKSVSQIPSAVVENLPDFIKR